MRPLSLTENRHRTRISVVTAALVFLTALNVFLWNITQPGYNYFDEVRYVNAARSMIGAHSNDNWSHPPLAKALIGVGMAVFGDRPIGWRIMSAIFGSLTLVLMYFWARALFQTQLAALAVVDLAITNHVHLIQSRIAMLDVFMVSFIMAGLTANWKGASPENPDSSRARLFLTMAGISFGLAAACKWFGFVPAAVCFCWYVWLHKNSFQKSLKQGFGYFLILPAAVYLAVSLGLMGLSRPAYQPSLTMSASAEPYSLGDVFRVQLQMLKAQLNFVNPNQPYQSHWLSWPLSIDPVWYDFRKMEVDGREEISAVLLCLNPIFAALGIAAILACLYLAVRKRADTASLFLLSCFFVFWLIWATVSRTTFFFYYYPASMMLCFVIVKTALSFRLRSWISIGCIACTIAAFFYFAPILMDIPIGPEAFLDRLIFPGWRFPPR